MKIINYLTNNYGEGNDYGLLILRIVSGLVIFYGHGIEKIQMLFSGNEIQFLDPIGIGGTTSFFMAFFAEAICAILIIVGLFTRWSALVLSTNFLVILFYHIYVANDGFQVLESRFLYMLVYVVIMLLGPGRISIDYLIFKNKRKIE
ncbi:MAG: DoxX family protein [Ignavibacteriota bacterium]|nr:DoxX family protein [Ignavibacterium sp.]MCO6446569.1 DoxX family protein [Ignavibacterium album]MCZ2268678.1 DoxX family protein [Ignavibacteriales bacterium]QKK00595.1 MAG: DoxX family protein [Ignavibacteriota bacterium]HOJ08185.1 DoxX family protein [Ignavibacteriaceae bacterium]